MLPSDSSFVDSGGRLPSKTPGDKTAQRGYYVLDDMFSYLAKELSGEQVFPAGAPGAGRMLKEPLAIMTEALTPRRLNVAALMRFSRVLHGKQSREPVGGTCAAAPVWLPGTKSDERAFDWDGQRALRAATTQAFLAVPPMTETQLEEIQVGCCASRRGPRPADCCTGISRAPHGAAAATA